MFVELLSGVGRLASSIAQQGGAVMLWDISMGAQYDLEVRHQKGLSERDGVKVDEGNTLLQFSVGILKLSRRMGAPCALESPASSHLFKTPGTLQISTLNGFRSAACDYCTFGTPWKNPPV